MKRRSGPRGRAHGTCVGGLATLVMLLGLVTPGHAAERHALVIGNRAYPLSPVPSAPNDMEEMAQTLEGLDFHVTRLPDATRAGMQAAVGELAARLRKDDVALIYFSGHGAQVQGENYLVPVDAVARRLEDIPGQTFALKTLFWALRHHIGPKIVLLDACRDLPPFPKDVAQALVPGLADNPAAPPDTVIGFATTPGKRAELGASEGHSPYTTALLRFLPTPGVRFADILMRVRISVEANTGGNQVPWENGSARAHFFFRPAATATVQFDRADDDAIVLLNGTMVSSWLRHGREPQTVELAAGPNPFTVFVYNDKTVGGGVEILGGKEAQGWDFQLTLSTAQGMRRTFHGSESTPVREGPRHGKLFEVVSGVLHVDERTGQVSMESVEEHKWEP